ncbi:MAG: alpha/beta fold hydrolase [Hyphomicrobiaceae bacterium]|jgi:esterase/lipase superfamily enzyme|nr:alpha/beta fold hydrolase [Hyphomicrobiaceae bacterium]MDX2448986.1 alpha/beta fold hydrolase [Hyphomicrobiaceae bacterium]
MGLNGRRFKNALRSVRVLVALVLIAVATSASSPARAQSPDDLAKINRQVAELAAAGKQEKAAALAKRYVALARNASGEDNPEYATAITWLSRAYLSQKRYADAERLLKQALVIRETALGLDHPLVATSLNNLASFYESQGRQDAAEPLIARAISIGTKPVGMEELEVLPRQIQELRWSGKPKEAVALSQRYLALAKARHGPDQPGLVPVLLDVASLERSQGRIAEAEALLMQVVAIQEETFGPDSPKVAESLVELALLVQVAGRYREAERLLRRALVIREAAYGKRHDQVIATMETIAGVYQAEGRANEAKKLFAAAQKLRRGSTRSYAYKRQEPTYAVVKVYYATDRKSTGATDPVQVYGGDRGRLTFGVSTVSIPRDHRMGALETPSVWRLEWSKDPERFVVLLSVTETDKAAFFKDVSTRVKNSAGKSAFIFVHGYNVTFADAARRTAQMAYDLGFDGAPVFYSWPSQASYASYKVDETNAEWSRLDFKNFLKDFTVQSDAEHIYLIAHSMGTRVLTGALKELVLEDPNMRSKFDEIILAAPDIDADTFERDIAPNILAGEGRATLYASSGDYALMASKSFAGYRRAGDTDGGVSIAPGVDTIDASSIRTDFVGHSYYADSSSVLGDLRDLILFGKRPEKRSRLAPARAQGGAYWTFKESADAAQ